MALKRLSLRHLLAVAVFAAACMVVPAVPAGAVSTGTCQTVTVKVGLAALLPKNLNIVGDLCLPNTWATGGHRVDALVHGGMYNRSYWDFPVSYSNYSYVERTLQAGQATFAFDRLGAGDSLRPLSALITLQSEAYVLHQVIGWLQANANNFAQVDVVGHSLGSLIAIEEAGTYNDVADLVVTGALHSTGSGVVALTTSLTVAALDPQFAGQGYDPGYLTTAPGTRSIFYSSAADPAVIAYDEAHKDVMAPALAFNSGNLIPQFLNRAGSVTANVLIMVGQQDAVFCGLPLDCSDPAAVAAQEAPYYSSAASFAAQTVANTGHDLALHPSAGTSFGLIDTWIEAH